LLEARKKTQTGSSRGMCRPPRSHKGLVYERSRNTKRFDTDNRTIQKKSIVCPQERVDQKAANYEKNNTEKGTARKKGSWNRIASVGGTKTGPFTGGHAGKAGTEKLVVSFPARGEGRSVEPGGIQGEELGGGKKIGEPIWQGYTLKA